jgi:hypothetical protein
MFKSFLFAFTLFVTFSFLGVVKASDFEGPIKHTQPVRKSYFGKITDFAQDCFWGSINFIKKKPDMVGTVLVLSAITMMTLNQTAEAQIYEGPISQRINFCVHHFLENGFQIKETLQSSEAVLVAAYNGTMHGFCGYAKQLADVPVRIFELFACHYEGHNILCFSNPS